MKCEFEEKQYEELLNHELAGKSFFPVGQVLEYTLGIDAALFTIDRKFWRLWQSGWKSFFPIFWKRGERPNPNLWNNAKRILDDRMFPKFKCNLFIQYKVPEYIYRRNSKEFKKKIWMNPYFRYDIEQNQWDILNRLEQKVAPNALVIYACPAFHKVDDLWDFRDKLIQKSNFVQPHILRNHSRYTFAKSGNYGIPCSEPTKIESTDLFKEIDRLWERETEFNTNTEYIYDLARKTQEVMQDTENEYNRVFNSIIEYANSFEQKLEKSLVKIISFFFIMNTSWNVGLDIEKEESIIFT